LEDPKGSVDECRKTFKLCQWLKMKTPIGFAPGAWTSASSAKKLMVFRFPTKCAEVRWGVAQQEPAYDNPEILEMASETTEVRKTPKSSRREQALVGNRNTINFALDALVHAPGASRSGLNLQPLAGA